MTNYRHEAQEHADCVLQENMEAIVDCVYENDGVLSYYDLEKVADWHDRVWEHTDGSSVSIYMDLSDAAEIMKQLQEHDPCDPGLWEGVSDQEKAICIKAYYFFQNAVSYRVQEALKKIENLDFDDCKHDEWDQALAAIEDKDLDELQACVERLDDLNGRELDKEKVEAAIREELGL
jgi:hypothetical protein